jgi:hypothetical protein
VVSNEIVPSAQSSSNNAPWATVTADITLPGGSPAAVVTASSTSTSTSSNTASVNLSPLTAATGTEKNHWIGGPATVASLDAANLTSLAPILGGGSSGNGRDAHSPANLGPLLDYMASAFADRSVGLMGAPMGDPATAATQHLLTTSHG